jgi:hypothetical protein
VVLHVLRHVGIDGPRGVLGLDSAGEVRAEVLPNPLGIDASGLGELLRVYAVLVFAIWFTSLPVGESCSYMKSIKTTHIHVWSRQRFTNL